MNAITTINVAEATTAELVAFYNDHAASPVKKFSDRATAEKRVNALIETLNAEAAKELEASNTEVVVTEEGAATEVVVTEVVATEGAATEGAATEVVVTEGAATEGAATEVVVTEGAWPFPTDSNAIGENFKKDQSLSAKVKQLLETYTCPECGSKEVFTGYVEPDSAVVVEDNRVGGCHSCEFAFDLRKKPGTASNSAGVAASWADPSVATARLTRHGVQVKFEGETRDFKSTRDAFRHYRLPDSKHIRFRGQLKAEGKKDFEWAKKVYQFTLVERSANEPAEAAPQA
jgi:transcription elongation factor Elf1